MVDLEILESIQEGNSDTHQLRVFTQLSLPAILDVLVSLEHEGLIIIHKKIRQSLQRRILGFRTDRKKKIIVKKQIVF